MVFALIFLWLAFLCGCVGLTTAAVWLAIAAGGCLLRWTLRSVLGLLAALATPSAPRR